MVKTKPTKLRRPVGDENGFTLIELLVVILIIGILAAIAIPQFLGRQSKAFDARVMTDIRSAAMGEEAYFDDNGNYFEGTCGGWDREDRTGRSMRGTCAR